VVTDSTLYGAGHIKDLDEVGTKFVVRLPGTLNEAQQVIQNTDLVDLTSFSAGYHAREKISEYGDVKQRWLIVYSEAAADRVTKSAAD
jgi:transposase